MNNKTEKKNTDSIDSVNQIRDILFGEQVKVIEQRFVQLESNLSKAINDLAKKVERNNSELKDKIDKSNTELQANSSNLAQQQSEDIKNLESAINNKIIETESDLVNQIQSGLQKLDDKASHRNELAQLLKDMAEKLSD